MQSKKYHDEWLKTILKKLKMTLHEWRALIIKGNHSPNETNIRTLRSYSKVKKSKLPSVYNKNSPLKMGDFFGEKPKKTEIMDLNRLKVHPQYFTLNTYLKQQERANWALVENEIEKFAAYFVEECRKMGVPMYVHCAFRTPNEQTRLYQQGRSKVQSVHGAHVNGLAVDIVHSRYHWELTEKEWQTIGIIGKRVAEKLGIKIRWGADWDSDGVITTRDPDESFFDPAHWELLYFSKNGYQVKDDILERDVNGATYPIVRKTARSILAKYKVRA